MKITVIASGKLDASISAFALSVGKVKDTAQRICVSILADLRDHGDKPTAVKRANALVNAMGKGMRAKSMLAWFEQNSPMVFNKETKALVSGFSAMSPVKDHTKIAPNHALAAVPWEEAAVEKDYVPLADWNAALKALVARAKTDLEKMGDKSKVNKEQLAMLERMAGVVTSDNVPH